MNRNLSAVLAAAAVSSLALSGCSSRDTSREQNDKAKIAAFQQQSSAVPYPEKELTDSLERRNIRERLLRNNKPNAIQYVYLLGDTGTYIGYYSINGKVSSTQSQMLSADALEKPCNGCDRYVVEAPGDDGSFGANEDGVFFFTTEGVMVTTDMRYIVSDAPLKVDAPKLNVPKS